MRTPSHELPLRRVVVADRQDVREQLARRQQEKAELEQRLHAVRRRMQEEVVPLKEEVLRRRMEQLRRAAQRHMRSAQHRNAYHDAQRAYETFRAERRPPEPPVEEDLKALYRAAGKRCHPDVVAPAYREQAAATFRALDAAYQAGHGRAVRAIAEALERWGFPAASSDEQKESLPASDLEQAVADLETDIEALRSTDAYQALEENDDVEAVLRAKKEKLIRILSELRSA